MIGPEPSASAPLPPHVAPSRLCDVDLYSMPGSEQDFLAAWRALQAATRHALVWTPRNGGHWIVLRTDEVARIYADHTNFSSRITIVPREWGEQYPLRPTTLDPPEHLGYRRVLTAILSPATVQRAEPRIRALAARAAERVRLRGECELIRDYAADLPLALFAQLAAIPAEQTGALPQYAADPRTEDSPQPVMERFAAFLRAIIAERRRRPGDDLISELANSVAAGRPLDEDEAVELATAVLTGGLDTVVSTLGLMMLHLARDTALRRRLVADPRAIPAAVTELLRRFPIMTKARLVRNDQELDGALLRAGDMIVLPPLPLDGGRGEQLAPGERRKAQQVTFGNGVHRCPGATLAQRELEIMLQEWLARIPEFSLDPRREPRMKGGVLGAVLSVHLSWSPDSTRPVAGA